MVQACKDRPYTSKSASLRTDRDLYNTATITAGTTTVVSSSNSAMTSAQSTSTAAVSNKSDTTTTTVLTSVPTTSTIFTVDGQTSSPSKGDKDIGLSAGAAAGIGVAGALIGVALIGALVWFIRRKRRGGAHELGGSSPYGHKAQYLELDQKESRSELYGHQLYEVHSQHKAFPVAEMPGS